MTLQRIDTLLLLLLLLLMMMMMMMLLLDCLVFAGWCVQRTLYCASSSYVSTKKNDAFVPCLVCEQSILHSANPTLNPTTTTETIRNSRPFIKRTYKNRSTSKQSTSKRLVAGQHLVEHLANGEHTSSHVLELVVERRRREA